MEAKMPSPFSLRTEHPTQAERKYLIEWSRGIQMQALLDQQVMDGPRYLGYGCPIPNPPSLISPFPKREVMDQATSSIRVGSIRPSFLRPLPPEELQRSLEERCGFEIIARIVVTNAEDEMRAAELLSASGSFICYGHLQYGLSALDQLNVLQADHIPYKCDAKPL